MRVTRCVATLSGGADETVQKQIASPDRGSLIKNQNLCHPTEQFNSIYARVFDFQIFYVAFVYFLLINDSNHGNM